ncbi:hypothetical protein M011DRAFT_457002 [Sporormia fimetaria CBS 119925]|uniref:Elongation of fatty acids protein n=1 Tax=Sporormia fimetaria CBS 119925 TaxID=1340428 RepID=A0A6A6VKA0_9PLEO|nr:hypothetical protein M011DRAFT_457002 [Sporormia fimetaria CBS 119925]
MSGAGPSLHPVDFPSWTVLKFPPAPLPEPIPPPFEQPSLRTPFAIPEHIFKGALDYRVPITIASVYATTVVLVNQYNRRHGNKPWAISKTRAFKAFVILHNVFLAVYSALTCYAMFQGLRRTFPHYSERNAFVGTVDALCKIQGPRGLGNAAVYDTDLNQWVTKNANVHMGPNGAPDPTDVGRMWNEGLAFWGWWFYLSKFYEVLDTVIILAKGKRSSTLQTYHHTGAMLCMWAGIRYMAGPIWVFVLVNSFIHAMMYTYYTVAALRIRVPQAVKRTLTSLQIAQFLLGGSLAGAHLFLSYTVPVSTPYKIVETIISTPIAAATPIVESLSSPAAAATATGAAVAFLRKMIYRAAGEEGLAENVPYTGDAIVSPIGHHEQAGQVQKDVHTRYVYRTEYQSVPCIDTSGQAFAVYLNVIYLAPLTFLFMRFFVKSYLRRTSPNNKHMTHHNAIAKSSVDAIHGVGRELETLGKAPDSDSDVANGRGRPQRQNTAQRIASLSPGDRDFVESVKRKAAQKLEELGDGIEASKEKAKQMAKEIADSATKSSSDAVEPNNEITGVVATSGIQDVEQPKGNGKKNKKKANGKA